MMLYPSVDKLVEKIPSKYSLIILASKRAHEMQLYKHEMLDSYEAIKPVGRALEEVVSGDLQIKEI